MLQDALKLPKDQTPDGEQLPETTRLGARAKSMAAPKGGAPLAGLDRGTIAASPPSTRWRSSWQPRNHEWRRPDLSASTKDSAWGPWGWMPAISRRTRSPPHCRRAENAVLQLTKIVSTLAQPKKALDLEAVLDQGSLPSSSESQSLGGGRKSAAAMRMLVKAFEENPRSIYETLEKQMAKDLNYLLGAAGSGGVGARAWLCARSRVLNYHNHVRWSWQVGGIWDDLMSGNNERARARAGLLLAAADQASIDGGSWVMSTVSLMEGVPPFQEFSKHALPSPAQAQLSALYDSRWGDLFLTALKEREASHEARRKLSLADRGGRPNVSRDDAADTGGGKAGGKGKPPKGKDKAGGGG